MRRLTGITAVAMVVIYLALFVGCVSQPDPKQVNAINDAVDAMKAYLRTNKLAPGLIGGLKLSHATAVFRDQNERWPKDYAELRHFAEQSGGAVTLGNYQSVELTNLPADHLEICFIPGGQTNKFTLTLPPDQPSEPQRGSSGSFPFAWVPPLRWSSCR